MTLWRGDIAIKTLIGVVMAALVVTALLLAHRPVTHWQTVQPGMTSAQVVRIMGAPVDTDASGTMRWVVGTSEEYAYFLGADGRVSQLDTISTRR